MIADIDIWRTAALLVKQHREDARIVAGQRADELFEAGDYEGAAVWRLIVKTIEELVRIKPADGERVN